MMVVKYPVLIVLIMFIFACSEDDNPVITNIMPQIDSVYIASKWNPQVSEPYKVEVFTTDPLGPSNISGVQFFIRREPEGDILAADSLYDDGAYYHKDDGDVFAGDGIFTNRFYPDQLIAPVQSGNYYFSFQVFNKQGITGRSPDFVVNFSTNFLPAVQLISAPDTYSINITERSLHVKVGDGNGSDDIIKVYFESQKTGSQVIKYEGELFDDGATQNGDVIAGDSIYSALLDTGFAIGKNGTFRLRFYAIDSYQELNETVPEHEIEVTNFAPQITNVNVPQTIEIPAPGGNFNRELVTVSVTDPEGLADVDSVYFFSQKPDGTFANNGLPIPLVDNGRPFNINNPGQETGDDVAGDGIYSFSLLVYSDTQAGTYRFIFYVVDKAENKIGPFEREVIIQ